MTTPWHMARVASRRQLPKPRKMHGPVGDEFAEPPFRDARDGEAWCCQKCGYHVCSCKPVERKKYMFPVTTGVETGQRPGSVDVAGLEMLRAEWFTEYHLRKAAEREQTTAFDDHFRHATEHALLAERMGRCALCYSTEHKLDDCLTMKAHLEALGMCR